MKKGLLKSLLCFALAGTLLFGDAGLTLAAVSNDVQPAAEMQQLQSTSTASVDYLYTSIYSDGSIYYSYYGNADKFEIYVNGVLVSGHTKYNSEYYWDYDDATGEQIQVYDEAPDGSYYGYLEIGAQPGATYKVEVVPYTHSGDKGTTKSSSVKLDFPAIEDVRTYVNQSLVYNAEGKTTGYTQYEGVYGYIEPSIYGTTYTYEVYRSTKKSSGYELITTVSGSYTVYWTDTTAKMGTKYYYKVRPVAVKDTYVSTQVNGSWSSAYEVVAGEPTADIYASYMEEGVYIGVNDAQMMTGMEVYRSTKKSKGYTKIATTADRYYLDTTAKSGKTYYYKVKPFFYNQKTKKKVYGEYSDVVAVKTNMSTASLEVTQTAKTKAKLEWTTVKGATTYEIYMKSDVAGDAYKYVGSTKKLSYTVKSLSSDTGYYFRVRAVKKANNVKSEYQVMTGYMDTGVHSPYDLRITKKSVSIKNSTMTIKSTLKWDTVYGASKYRVEAWSSEKSAYVTLQTIKKNTTTSYTLTNTKKKDGSWKYSYVRVVAIKGDEEYTVTNYGITDLADPTNVKVTYASATSAKVSWKQVSGATSYTITRTAPNGQACVIGTTDKLNIKDTCLTPGVNYTYSVSATNETYGVYNEYEYSDDGIASWTATYAHKVTAPKISKVTNSAAKKATIKWGKVDGATKYVIYRATSKDGKYSKLKTVTGTSYTDTKLTKGKTYYYKVVAVTTNDAGLTVESAKSTAKSVKISK